MTEAAKCFGSGLCLFVSLSVYLFVCLSCFYQGIITILVLFITSYLSFFHCFLFFIFLLFII